MFNNVNVNVNLYSALWHSASNAPNTAENDDDNINNVSRVPVIMILIDSEERLNRDTCVGNLAAMHSKRFGRYINMYITAKIVENTVLTGTNKASSDISYSSHELIFDLGYNYSVAHIHLYQWVLFSCVTKYSNMICVCPF